MKVLSFFLHALPLIVKSTGLLKYNFYICFCSYNYTHQS